MVQKLGIQYSGVVYDVMDRGGQREALFGDGQLRGLARSLSQGERNRQMQSEAEGRLET
jgi:hypothetical protein